MSTAANSPANTPTPPSAPRKHGVWRVIGRTLLGLFVLLILVIGGAYWYATTSSFANLVRGKVIDILETSTGGRVELSHFSWHPLKLEVELDNLTIHGLEPPQDIPYAHLDKLLVRAKIISLFKEEIGLRLLQVEHPVVHLIIYPDGSTNQPVPKTKTQSNTSAIDTVFDLAVNRTLIDNGLILVNQRAIPFNLAANDLSAKVDWLPASDHYLGTLHVEDLTAVRAKAPMVHSKLDLNVEMARNALQLKALHFASGKSNLEASAAVADFTKLNWHIAANGSIDLREIAALANVDGLGPGEAVVQVKGEGTGTNAFALDGNLKLNGATYRSPSLLLSGLNATTSLHATQTEILLPNLMARLRQGGGVDANIKVVNWLPPAVPAPAPGATPTAPNGSVSVSGTKAAKQAAINANRAKAPGGPPQEATIHAKVFGLKLQTVLETIAAKKYENLGFDTQANGTADVHWVGSVADMTADAKIALAPPRPPTPNEVPVTGILDVGYAARGGRLNARHVELHTRGSSVQLSGVASVSPATGPSSLKADLVVTNLNEFDRALIAFGVSSKGSNGKGTKGAKGKKGVAALPVQLHGQASFHGTITGSLLAPDVKGHLSATDFATVIETAAVPPPPANAVPVSAAPPQPPPPSAANQQTIQWDDLEADAEYSPSLISIQGATLRRGNTSIHAAGQLQAHHLSRHRLAFDDYSPLTATASVSDASITELLSIAGEKLPVTGTLNLQAHVGGTLGNLNGGGHLSVLGGDIYGEPYKSLNTDLTFAGKEAGVSNLVLAQDGGRLTGDAAYNTATQNLRANVNGTGFQLAHFKQLQTGKISVAGALTFELHAAGTPKAPQVNGHVQLANIVLGGEPAGGLTADLRTQDNTAYLTAQSNIVEAQLNLAAQTVLSGNYETQAKLSFSKLDIDPLLKIADVNGIKGHSAIAGVVTVSGPATTPKLLNGDVDISQFSVTLQGLPITTQGDIRASLRNGIVDLTQLHITAEDTDLVAHGTADIFGNNGVDLHAKGSVNAKLAQTFNTEISSSGHVDFYVDAIGPLKKPDVAGKVTLTNVNFAYQEIPNGISRLNGTLEFTQDRLQIMNLVGTSGGGQIKLGGFLMYQGGIYGDVTATAKDVRVRYAGISMSADASLRLQGTQNSLLLSGDITITRFLVGPNVDFAALAGSGAVSPPPDPNAPLNKLRLDVHVTSAPSLDFQNSFAQLAGTVDLRIRGTAAQPSVLGRINITDGQATFANTTYQLQHGDIYFTNPVHIEPTIDLDATTRIEEYDVTIGLHGTANKLKPTFRSEPPLPEADVISLLAQGRTQEEQSIYSSEQSAAGVNGTTDALLSGALNATVSSRIQKLFGVGSVKIDPTYVGALGNSSARITVQENIGQNVQLTYATNVNTTSSQLIQAQLNLSPTLSVTAVRDEADVFSLLFKVHHRYR